jgi:hypothetical protein
MSRTHLWNPIAQPDKSGKDLAVVKIGAGRPCPIQETYMSGNLY